MLLACNPRTEFVTCDDLSTFMIDCVTPGNNPVLPLFKLDKKKGIVRAGSALFKKDRMIASINLIDTRTMVLLRGRKAKGYIPFVVKRDGLVVNRGSILATNSRRVRVTRQGDRITFHILVKVAGNLKERTSTASLVDHPEELQAIESSLEADLKQDCDRFVSRMQKEYRVDCIDITRFALAKWRKELTPQADQGLIEKANIMVEVKVHLDEFGEST